MILVVSDDQMRGGRTAIPTVKPESKDTKTKPKGKKRKMEMVDVSDDDVMASFPDGIHTPKMPAYNDEEDDDGEEAYKHLLTTTSQDLPSAEDLFHAMD
jgi:hypothetical protein